MEALLQWGLDCIRLIQGWANPPLTVFMRLVTALGSAGIYIAAACFVYWCIDEKKGLHLGLMMLLSLWINLSLKWALDQPRPFFPAYDPSLGMISERLGGFPSGHAQNTLVALAVICSWLKKKWAYSAAAFVCLLIGFSRVYLGVHFPTDVIGGWLIGGVTLAAYFLARKRIEALLAKGGFRGGIYASAALAFVMILYRPSVELLIPGGMILGLGAGYNLCKYYLQFSASAHGGRTDVFRRLALLVRFLLGITVFALLYVVTGKITGGMHNSGNYQLVIFLRFALLSLWISAGAPWLFRFLRLAERA
ncbi:MAG: phosphatase PAP2 family protein [Treponema sp.]|nr:phosphatase PAP2 family protein [Treponema sp.]